MVTWKQSDDDIPLGSVGVILEIKDDGERHVQWPKGVWGIADLELATTEQYTMAAKELLLCPGKAVTLKQSDDDIPASSVGVILEIKDDGKRHVQWPKGVWGIAPQDLERATTD